MFAEPSAAPVPENPRTQRARTRRATKQGAPGGVLPAPAVAQQGETAAKKTFVLDTNVLLHSALAL